MWKRWCNGSATEPLPCGSRSTWEWFRSATVAVPLVHACTAVRSPSQRRGDGGERIRRTQDSHIETLNHDMRKSLVINDPFWRLMGSFPETACSRIGPLKRRTKTSNTQQPTSNIQWPRLGQSLDVGWFWIGQPAEGVKKLAKGPRGQNLPVGNQRLTKANSSSFRFFHTFAGLPEGSRWSFRAKGGRPPEGRVGWSSTPAG